MKPRTENEITGKACEVTDKSNEHSNALTRTDTMTQNKWSSKYTTFAVGVGIGALVGLLFAPATGRKTRGYIANTVKQGLDDVASTGKQWTRSARETMEDVKSTAAGVIAAGGKAYRTARDA